MLLAPLETHATGLPGIKDILPLTGRELPTSLYIVLFFVLIAGNISVYREIFAPRVLRITILDVGEKGNATLVRDPNGATLLIDTGPDASILRALGEALPEWQKTIDAVVLTSATAAAAKGLPDVLTRYQVSALIRAGAPGSKSLEDALAAAASAETGLRQSTVPHGTRLSHDAVNVDIISPASLNISYGSTSFKISSSTPKGVYTSDGTVIRPK
jgi:beta-lactamase superfamily II metal-dependent hydrolase